MYDTSTYNFGFKYIIHIPNYNIFVNKYFEM